MPGVAGRLCALFYKPAEEHRPGRCVLHVPAFAEEMNKCRRMVSLQAEALARTGAGVLILDLFGTGDSDGDFREASWPIWLDDLNVGAQWLKEHGGTNLTLWGLRLGCLLSVDYVRQRFTEIDKQIFWQPVTNGRMMLRQFFRLRVAATMIGHGDGETLESLWARLHDGSSVEIAGYEISPELAKAIDNCKLEHMIPPSGADVHWLELASSEEQRPSAASRKVLGEWSAHSIPVDVHLLTGDNFWATQETTIVSSLLKETTSIFRNEDS